jgi:hypothetical protein
MTVALVWEAISGVAMIIGGVLPAAGLATGSRWFDRFDRPENGSSRIGGIIFGIFLSLAGTYLINLARTGIVRSR